MSADGLNDPFAEFTAPPPPLKRKPRSEWASATSRDWDKIKVIARELFDGWVALIGTPMPQRQLHYGIAQDPRGKKAGYTNDRLAAQALSRHTTEWREADEFPEFEERQVMTDRDDDVFPDVPASLRQMADNHRIDRNSYLPVNIVLVAEADSYRQVLATRYPWLNVATQGGYSGPGFAKLFKPLTDDSRDNVILYLGDWDGSGEKIEEKFAARVARFGWQVHRVGLHRHHVKEFGLLVMPGKDGDSRSKEFFEKHGVHAQVEVEALGIERAWKIMDAALQEWTGFAIRADGYPDILDADWREAIEMNGMYTLADLVERATGRAEGGDR